MSGKAFFANAMISACIIGFNTNPGAKHCPGDPAAGDYYDMEDVHIVGGRGDDFVCLHA